MKNKNVGFLIMAISVVIGIIIFIFNIGLKKVVASTCTHGPACTMYTTIATQTYISLAIALLVFFIGLFFVLSKESERIVIKKEKVEIEKKRKPLDYSKLDKEEKLLIKIIEGANGTIFQSDLVDKSNFSKVKVSRILDRLENKNLIERKRRGMTNVVVLR